MEELRHFYVTGLPITLTRSHWADFNALKSSISFRNPGIFSIKHSFNTVVGNRQHSYVMYPAPADPCFFRTKRGSILVAASLVTCD